MHAWAAAAWPAGGRNRIDESVASKQEEASTMQSAGTLWNMYIHLP